MRGENDDNDKVRKVEQRTRQMVRVGADLVPWLQVDAILQGTLEICKKEKITMKDEWIDLRGGYPEVGTKCVVAYGYGKMQQATVAVAAKSMAKGRKDWPYFLSALCGVVDEATHYKVISPLPPSLRPRGPFRLIDSDNGLAILHGNKTYGVAQWSSWPMGGLVDWLNEMVLRGENDDRR